MPYLLNFIICIVGIGVLITELVFILKRNRKILVKGKDDFFLPVLIMLFLILIMPLDDSISAISALRNMLALMAVFVTFGIKRGVSLSGIEKLCWTILWDKIATIHINSHQTMTAMLVCKDSAGRTSKLIFHHTKLRPLLRELQKHMNREQIFIEQSMECAMEKYSHT